MCLKMFRLYVCMQLWFCELWVTAREQLHKTFNLLQTNVTRHYSQGLCCLALRLRWEIISSLASPKIQSANPHPVHQPFVLTAPARVRGKRALPAAGEGMIIELTGCWCSRSCSPSLVLAYRLLLQSRNRCCCWWFTWIVHQKPLWSEIILWLFVFPLCQFGLLYGRTLLWGLDCKDESGS